MRNKYINKNISIYLVVMLLVMGVFLLIGSSYALVQKVIYGRNVVSMQTGSFLVEFINSDAITLTNKIPVYDDVGMNSGDEFTFSITNNGNHNASYNIYIEDNSDNNLSEVMRYAINYGDGYSYQNIHALKNNHYIIQNKSLAVGSTDTYSLRFWLDIDAGESYAGLEFNGKIKVTSTQEEYKYATNIIEKVYNSTDQEGIVAIGEDGNVYESGEIREYRYSRDGEHNYVWFNCDEGYTSGNAHCEKWRIIGSFTNTYKDGVSEYPVLKIVRDDILENDLAFNTNEGNYANFDGSSIEEYLNNEYYNTFSKSTKDLIMNAKWSIGNVNVSNYLPNIYNEEKNISHYNNVGLLNVSDYGYAGASILEMEIELNRINFTSNANWLYTSESFWLLNSENSNSSNMLYAKTYTELDTNDGIVYEYITVENGSTTDTYGVRPVVYLKPDVSIIAGFGTSDSPYELAIKHPMYYGTKTEIKVESIALKTLGKLNLNVNTSSDGCPVEGEEITSVAGSGVDLICEYSDDDGKTYYFRGASTHNYVKWAGFYWRIIRVNGDGSIRMIYAGDASTIDSLSNKAEVLANGYNDSTTNYKQIGENKYNGDIDGNLAAGLMYGDFQNIYEAYESVDSITVTLTASSTYYYYGDNYSINPITGVFSISRYKWITLTSDNISTLIGNYVFPLGIISSPSHPLLYVESVDATTLSVTGKIVTRKLLDDLDTSAIYDLTHENSNYNTVMGDSDSLDITTLNGWYNVNLKNTNYEYHIKDSVVCNDRSLYKTEYGDIYSSDYGEAFGVALHVGTSPNSGLGIGNEVTAYGSYYRIKNTNVPILKCLQENDRFTVSDSHGNQSLVNSIGLLTIDETMLAGGINDVSNNKYYLYSGYKFWTSSPLNLNERGNLLIGQNGNNGSLLSASASSEASVRPVLSIDPDNVEITGSGTWNDPFIFS